MSENGIDKAVWCEDLERVRDVVELLERTYTNNAWTGAMIFQDLMGGFLVVACFDPDVYGGDVVRWESLFPPRDLRPVTLEAACYGVKEFRPWLAADIPATLRFLKLLPT